MSNSAILVDDLTALRQRTSLKWRELPRRRAAALGRGDGRAAGRAGRRGRSPTPSRAATPATPPARRTPQALAEFAGRGGAWDGLAVERTALVPDVMHGVVEVLRAGHRPGRRRGGQPARSTRRSYDFVAHAGPPGRGGAARRGPADRPRRAGGRVPAGRAGGRRAAYLLCSPHNPTGIVHTADELTAVAALADRHGVRVVADEIHAPLVAAGTGVRAVPLVPGAENGLSLMSASKAWNLAGLKARSPSPARPRPATWPGSRRGVSSGTSHLGVIAHTAAFRTAASGSTPCWPAWTTTGGCSPRCSPSTCRPSGTSPAGHLPGLARLPRPRPRRRPRRRVPRPWPGGAQPGPPSAPAARARPAEPGHRPHPADRGRNGAWHGS